MNLFDKLKQKSLEKMLQKMAGGGSAQEMLKSMGASEGEISQATQALKGMNFAQILDLANAMGGSEAMTAEKVQSLLDPALIEQLASKLHVEKAEAPQRIAEMLNSAKAQMRERP